MLKDYPVSYEAVLDWGWAEFEPFAEELLGHELSDDNFMEWLQAQSRFLALIHELNGRVSVAVDQDILDETAKERRDRFKEQVWEKINHVTNQLERKLVSSGLIPADYEIQLRQMRSNLNTFHPNNVELETEVQAIREQYKAIQRKLRMGIRGGNYSVFDVLRMLHIEQDRNKREFIFKKILDARLEVKERYDEIWKKVFALRQQIAQNTGFPDYRAYMWQKLNRHDFSPQDVFAFCEAVEKVVVPVMAQLRQQQADSMGVKMIKPWDKSIEIYPSVHLQPYQNVEEWLDKSREVFARISPVLVKHFDLQRSEGLMDLESRPNKSPWNYAEILPASSRTFIFINGRGGNADLFMLFHEFGHAVHQIEMSEIAYMRQRMLPEEMGEVASTTMELLACEHLDIFYPQEQAEVVRHNHLLSMILRWPFVAMIALFQHWAYTNPEQGANPVVCDEYWRSLHERFMPGIDYTGFKDDVYMEWREFMQVFVFPFYAIEYAFAQVGAVQIWQNYRTDPRGAMEQWLQALKRGHTINVPEFYKLAGAKFAVDAQVLQNVVDELKGALLS